MNVKYLLVSTYLHHHTAAEHAILILKNYLIAGIYICDPKCPVSYWNKSLLQVILTLNFLQLVIYNDFLSAHTSTLGKG